MPQVQYFKLEIKLPEGSVPMQWLQTRPRVSFNPSKCFKILNAKSSARIIEGGKGGLVAEPAFYSSEFRYKVFIALNLATKSTRVVYTHLRRKFGVKNTLFGRAAG